MRNTNTSQETETVYLAKISEFKKLYPYEHVKEQINELLFAWIGSDFITTATKIERENTLLFLNELKSLMKVVLDDQLLSNEISTHYLMKFSDDWSLSSIKDKLKTFSESFILSDIADDKTKRSNVFDFLNQTGDFLLENEQIQK